MENKQRRALLIIESILAAFRLALQVADPARETGFWEAGADFERMVANSEIESCAR